MRKLTEQSILSVPPETFGSLSALEQSTLRRWAKAAREAGITDVRDLSGRHWPTVITGAVIGVFTLEDEYAAWLAVEQNGLWAVACCLDGTVSPPVDTLEGALEIVCRALDYRTGGASADEASGSA